jgi:predicted ester cyclase
MKKIILLPIIISMISCHGKEIITEYDKLKTREKLEEQNKESVRRWLKEIDKRNFAIVDELVADNCMSHYGDSSYNNEWVTKSIEAFPLAFNEYEHIIEGLYVENDKVCAAMTVKVKHTGSFADIPPSGKSIDYKAFSIYRFKDGKIIEMWWDTNAVLGLMAKLESNQ